MLEPPCASFGDPCTGEPLSEIALVLPTYNERENISELISRLRTALHGLRWEILFVDDDSPDGTADEVRRFAAADARIRLIQRIGRRGLSSACIEGMLATSAPVLAVMDADLQHDEAILPIMLEKLRSQVLEMVVATRNAEGGSMGAFSARRVWISRLGQRISRSIAQCELSDPMSGFFMLRRSLFVEVVHRLHGGGFKILLDILATAERPVRVGEVGYTFRQRRFGASKLDPSIAFEYFSMIVNKRSGGLIPTRLTAFVTVAASGLGAHLLALALMLNLFECEFTDSQIAAAAVAALMSFFVHHLISAGGRRPRGLQKLMRFAGYCGGCLFGVVVNVTFAVNLLHVGAFWCMAGIGGAVVGAGWNDLVLRLLSWCAPRPRTAPALPPYGLSLPAR